MIALDRLNASSQPEFVRALDGIFEHTAWVAERAHAVAPFRSRLQLLDALRAVVYEATLAEQIALIMAHPRLGRRARQDGDLTAASAHEQRRAGLAACSDAQYAVLRQLNDAYFERYGFPFILAVRGYDPQAIVANLEMRLHSEIPFERSAALHEIGLIASYRLAERVASGAEAEFAAMCERLARCPVQSPEADGVRAALLREWLLAAGFEVSRGGVGPIRATLAIPTTPTTLAPAAPGAPRLLIGAAPDFGSVPDFAAGGLVYEEPLGFLAAIALAQQSSGDGLWPCCRLELAVPRRDLNLLTDRYPDPSLHERTVPALRQFLRRVQDHG
jgi:2-oxo-4-hydroxy-4-carboxy-5-ureidoimidazoline decarboxylase